MNATLMKTCALTAFAIAAMSCAKEHAVENGLPAEVSFAIETPSGISTKANGDGSLAKDLYYQVFDKDMKPVSGLNLQQKDLVNGKTTVNFQLVKDQVYNFIFWAQTKKSGYYTIDKSVGGEGLKKITADYSTNKAANDENRDAFFAVVKELKIDGPLTQNVKLTRPFAQVNIGVDDKLSDGPDNVDISKYLTGAKSSFSVKQIPTVFSPMNGEVSEPEDVVFEAATIPGDNLNVNEVTYNRLSMNYVFAPAERSVYDISATFQFDGKEVSFSSPTTPLQRNYRTNIVGSLLTNTADFNVEVDPDFGGDEVVTVWDGTSITAVTEVDGVYEISNAAELAWVAQQVNAGTTFAGKTVKLVNDINLGYKAWTPIGGLVTFPGISFHGTFDGNGKTISNLYASDNTVNHASAGLFGGLQDATVKDLTVKNAIISSTHLAGVICGYVESSTISNCKVSNVKVTSTVELLSSGNYDNGDKVGGIVGHLCYKGTDKIGSSITSCTVENAKIQGYRDLGGFAGYVNSECSVTGNKLEGTVIIKVDGSHNYKDYTKQSDYDANAYVGEKDASATVSDNTGEATIDFSDAFIAGYSESGTAVALPAGPDMSGDIVNVTAANAQYTLDGAYGSIDGKTINFTESISETLVLGRPNRFPGSNTKYMVGGYTSDASGYQEFATAEELAAYLKTNSGNPYYTRAVNNVKFTASEGVTIEGVAAWSGHIYGTETSTVYDYVLDNGVQYTNTSPSYHDAYNFTNITFEGINFVKNAKFTKNSNSEGPATINGLTFKACKFLTYSTEIAAGARLYFQNNSTVFENAFKNIVVDGCSFDTSRQGVYTQYVYGLTVKNSTFTTTGHNAIALQSLPTVTPNYGAVVIENNTFDKIGDRVIRFGDIGADTQITITGNIATNSGDSVGEVMKASTLASGITYDIHDNDWGEGTVANNELEDKVTE